ncbi:FAD-dependent oxidoreductase [Saccharolobus solfataricus]|uniref:FAD-binding oxidoreductase n=1 Tax=Saccharolobus solfataricus TaxID=2287 RepID=A0A0E3K0A0_SACSO|nr:FAD-dependent oxidoreductase [Saccharolobus solfataricus]AKA73381.1 FAD-binding oxidoreductase [Saccharolobus solfataricus]AKA76080.1 FAD-binding oxidoreductase [Saccharolobus solfataricus]AKA78773.1 FAD-binding oxidoreductase [Saccharolobus solfataricus]QPG50361.1 FAD-binding oxidoreductase [Saccharolobus solfataricus]SAI83577.1 FAD-dependent oxidoreductase [Saccharolobus solfataricus]
MTYQHYDLKVIIVGGGIVGSSIYRLLKKNGIEVQLIDPKVKRPFPSLIHSLLLKGKDIELAKLSLNFYKKFNIPYYPFKSYTLGKINSSIIDSWISAGVNINVKYVNWINDQAIEAIGGDGLVSIGSLINSTEKIIYQSNIVIDKGKGFVKINNKLYESDLIILSAGAWSKYLINVKLPVKTYYCWASLFLSKKKEVGSNIIYDYVNNFYSRPVIGLGFPLAIMGDGKAIETTPLQQNICIEDKNEVSARISRRLGEVKELYTSGSFCEATPDMRPAYGKIAENVYFIGGFNGYGAEVGPGLAHVLVEEILSKKEDTYFTEYRLERLNGYDGNFEIGQEPHEL